MHAPLPPLHSQSWWPQPLPVDVGRKALQGRGPSDGPASIPSTFKVHYQCKK